MAAWDDTLTWAERDEAVDFDGVAGYPNWEQEDAIVADLRAELRKLDGLIDEVVACFRLPDADSPVRAGEAGDSIVHPAASEEWAA